jgi:lipopolysaccharide assembly outer membrane protein LptD (OstA)
MKTFAPFAALIGCLAAYAQELPPVSSPANQPTNFRVVGGVAIFPAPQLRHLPGNSVSFAASSIERDASILRLRGSVEIKTNLMVLNADEVDYHWDTGEYAARGNVYVTALTWPTILNRWRVRDSSK